MTNEIKPLADMTIEELREAYARVARAPAPLLLGRRMLVRLIEGHAPPPPKPKPAPKPRRPRMACRGVGRYVRELLALDVGGNRGLSYSVILKKTLKKFPESAVDQKHIAWYATSMRADNKTIPTDRERSRWK